MNYYLMIFGELYRDRLASALAALMGLPIDSVDIADKDEIERNWSAPILCTVSPVAGHLHWFLDVYFAETITQPPTDAIAAAWLAQRLRTVVVHDAGGLVPSYWLVGPDGRRTRARIDDDDIDDEGATVYRIDAVEHPVAALPHLPVAAVPEVIRYHRLPSPLADQLKVALKPWSNPDIPSGKAVWEARNNLGAWEGMVSRLAAGWPPDGWYPVVYYRENMEYRDMLTGACQTSPEQVREAFSAAVDEVDQRFISLTEHDGGVALTAELGQERAVPNEPERWWWHRIPQPVPWRDQSAPLAAT